MFVFESAYHEQTIEMSVAILNPKEFVFIEGGWFLKSHSVTFASVNKTKMKTFPFHNSDSLNLITHF